jgi:hypothetical protein
MQSSGTHKRGHIRKAIRRDNVKVITRLVVNLINPASIAAAERHQRSGIEIAGRGKSNIG